MAEETKLFHTEKLIPGYFRFALPVVFSMVITLIYNLADTFFVGHTGDPAQVAALTLVFPIFMLLTGIGNLFGIGANSCISRSLGVGDHEGARRVCAFAFWGGLSLTAVMLLALGILLKPILFTMGASDMTVGPAGDYILWVMLVGGLPTEASLLLAHMLRGEGSTKEASAGMMLGGILNMILDPVFIFGLHMGVGGAGFATMLSNLVCLCFYGIVLYRNRANTVVSLHPKRFRFQGSGEILLVGLPAAMVIALGSSANILLTRLMSAYSDLAVASYGVTQKFGTVAMNLSIGLTQGIMPLIGYNYAAKNFPRVRAVARCSFVILLCFVLLIFGTCQLFPEPLMRLFVTDPDTVALGSDFLVRWSFAIPGMAFVFLISSIFQAMGRWKRSLLLNVLRQGVIFMPALLIMNRIFGMYGLVWAQPVADLLALALGIILYGMVARELSGAYQHNTLTS